MTKYMIKRSPDHNNVYRIYKAHGWSWRIISRIACNNPTEEKLIALAKTQLEAINMRVYFDAD